MSDKEKFEGFKQAIINENEEKYGAEIREKYGANVVEASNAHMKGLTQMQYNQSERLRHALEDALLSAINIGDPASEAAQKACDLHKEWLSVFYPHYTKEYHISLGEMYVSDERFRAHYDKLAPGCAEFLRDAINIYCE